MMEELFCLNGNFQKVENVYFRREEKQLTKNVKRVEISVVNGATARELIPVVEWRRKEEIRFYLIPCVSYNGNEFGTDNAPRGMTCQDEAWIFSSDRTGLPGCSVVETEQYCFALFAGNDLYSKRSSCSLYTENGETVQRLYFAHLESPKAYIDKGFFGAPVSELLPFAQGEEKRFVYYLYEYKKIKDEERYAYKKLFDFVNEEEYVKIPEEKFSVKQVKAWNSEFIASLIEKTDFGLLSNIGFLPNGEQYVGKTGNTFQWRKKWKYEAGWCGQNLLIAELYLRAYKENGNTADLETAKGILETWMLRQHENGLISAHYDLPFSEEEEIDTCNEGWILSELIECSILLKELGEDATRYEFAAKRICDFFVAHFLNGKIPQTLAANGTVRLEKGGAGAFVMLGLVHSYEYFKDEKYLRLAKNAFAFYYGTYLRYSIAAGGALDTYCVDKESAYPVLATAIGLYKTTGQAEYLEYAENIAHYLMTWCFYHDVDFDKNSDCGKIGLYTTGGTSVSVTHHHLDCWGAYYVPDMIELYRLTGNKAYRNHARILWRFTTQYISDGGLKLHGMTRSRGMQNEAIFHCRWGSSDRNNETVKGMLNDWMVAWIKAFQQKTIYRMGNGE